jgi:hypothetical protein
LAESKKNAPPFIIDPFDFLKVFKVPPWTPSIMNLAI